MAFDGAILIISFTINSTLISGIFNEPGGLRRSTSGKEESNFLPIHDLCYRRNHKNI